MSAKLFLGLALACALAVALLLEGCQQTTPPTNQSAMNAGNSKAWDLYVNDFLEAYFVAHPDFAVRAGRHEFDGRLPDWSAEGLAKEIKRLHAEKDRISGFQDAALTEQQRLEREY